MSRASKRAASNDIISSNHTKSTRVVFLKQQQVEARLFARSVAQEDRKRAIKALQFEVQWALPADQAGLVAQLRELHHRELEVPDLELPELGQLDESTLVATPATPATPVAPATPSTPSALALCAPPASAELATGLGPSPSAQLPHRGQVEVD